MNPTKVLIIEDNIVTLGDLEMRLRQMAYEQIATAVSDEEAIEMAATFNPNIIISDIHLGKGINGIEAVRRIKLLQNIPVVYLTAYDDDKTLAQAGVTEPYAYLLKPFQERELQISLSIALYKHNIENELKEANATKDRFISILGHDLKNSFNQILGFSNILKENIETYDRSTSKKIVGLLHNVSKHTYLLLSNLLEWSISKQKKMPLFLECTDILDMLNDTILLYKTMADEKKITINVLVPQNLEAKLDKEMIKVLMRNLLSNAIEFTPHNGCINISAKQNGLFLIFEISDNGIGMDENEIISLFRIDNTNAKLGTNGEKGTGFGLLLIKELLEKQGGKILVKSELNKGSSFEISLPMNACCNDLDTI
jgi:signal transduction histidine kinase